MAMPKRITVSGTGNSAVIPMNHRYADFKLSIICDLTGTATYSVLVTGDDVQAAGYDPDGGSATWQSHSTLDALTASDKGHLEYPATALRLSVTGTGSVRMTLLEPNL